MNIKQLEYFIEVANSLNFTKAAKSLFVSQSAVTRQISLLEKELGTELLKRNNKSVSLTHAGEIFLKDALDILHKIENTQSKIQDMKMGEQGSLHLGYIYGLERTSMVASLHQFYQQYPHCHISYDSKMSYQLRKQLICGQMDMILTHTALDDADHENHIIFQSPIMVYVSSHSQYAHKTHFTQKELASLHLICDTKGIFHEQEQFMMIDHLLLQVMGDKGSAILPRFAIEYTQFQNYIIGIPIQNMEETIYAVYKRGDSNPFIPALIELLRKNSR